MTSNNQDSYDAIVVGSGISGGWAAKELTEGGLKVLLLERGRDVKHIKDYPTAFKHPWDFKNRLHNSQEDLDLDPIQSHAYNEGDKEFYVRDKDHPYIQDTPFRWIRGYQVGGRSLTWGRQCYRLSDLDFEANLNENIGIDWPIRYEDIASWYSYVEKFVGIAGRKEGLAHLPDSHFLPEIEMNCVEDYFSEAIRKKYLDRIVTPGRTANLTQGYTNRGPCQFRNLCSRGCPFGGYFSSNSATLPAANSTGNLTVRPFSVVQKVIYDASTNRALGVSVIDTNTKEVKDFYSKVVFLNASTIATAAILLNSKSERFPNGLGNDSDQVGRNLMDHFVLAGAEGELDTFGDKYYSGRNPGCIYIPRFRNIDSKKEERDFLRGYAFQGKAYRQNWNDKMKTVKGFGESYKAQLARPGKWKLEIAAWGETLPYSENRVTLDHNDHDDWDMPLVKVHFEYGENEHKMREDIISSAQEMLERTGFKNVNTFSLDLPGGSAIHEMGTARMGKDPKTSVLNKNNQIHAVPNVFITDGSCMTSSANQNPSLTYMALTARASNFAIKELKSGRI